ncbi:hypothetical protein GQ457_03G012460 [Hibiscus cannabinus]
MGCNVVNAEIWTHNARAAAVIHVVDHSTQLVIQDPKRVLMINELLFNVMRGDGGVRTPSARMSVSVLDCSDRDYTVVTIRCLDRPKLLFDTICCLTDMEYVVFHGTVITGRMEAYQAEEQRVMECLEAAIERRTTESLQMIDRTSRSIRYHKDNPNEAARFHLCRCIVFFAKESRKA